ncbi:MAG: hypothetical protein HLUCCA13_08675 [Halomonas sp. HL-48]|nr:hypothetical protein [Halomonas sp. HL-48]KPQ24580.1 MAG: hypothetical protein HLUCCA13_08675 [Halomonas sp. HL-48]
MNRIYSYVVQHDHGFAPNPFMGICTLANCKPKIRKFAEVGDLIIGTGSADVDASGHLVYWMRVSKIINYDEYWLSSRFGRKKPVMNGSMMQRYGDNIYYTGSDGTYQQIDSFHSEEDGSLSISNRERDTGSTSNVLIGEEFTYFGKAAPPIPQSLHFLVKSGPGHKCNFSNCEMAKVEDWLATLAERGYVGEPGRW